jgi:hypothetical protein
MTVLSGDAVYVYKSFRCFAEAQNKKRLPAGLIRRSPGDDVT